MKRRPSSASGGERHFPNVTRRAGLTRLRIMPACVSVPKENQSGQLGEGTRFSRGQYAINSHGVNHLLSYFEFYQFNWRFLGKAQSQKCCLTWTRGCKNNSNGKAAKGGCRGLISMFSPSIFHAFVHVGEPRFVGAGALCTGALRNRPLSKDWEVPG